MKVFTLKISSFNGRYWSRDSNFVVRASSPSVAASRGLKEFRAACGKRADESWIINLSRIRGSK